MSAVRALFIDDEPDIREIIAISLGLDPELSSRGCASGEEGLAAAAEDVPDIILLDVMMPGLDGPSTLLRLRDEPRSAAVPVVFMTARAQSHEIQHFKFLGAAGVIAKPFNPMTLAAEVRGYARPADDALAESRATFLRRLGRDFEVLFEYGGALQDETVATSALPRIRDLAHGLAGVGGIFGFPDLGDEASVLEEAATARLNDAGKTADVERAIERLLTGSGGRISRSQRGQTALKPPKTLDRALFNELRESFGASRTRSLLAKFEAQLGASQITSAASEVDRAALEREAHRLISTAGALGFAALSHVAREIENACRDESGDPAVLQGLVERAVRVKVATERDIRTLLDGLAGVA